MEQRRAQNDVATESTSSAWEKPKWTVCDMFWAGKEVILQWGVGRYHEIHHWSFCTVRTT